ncbi:chromatin assembly factor 1 subunit A-domain-containing protein [Cokeromyces recurvatus]|uniref:chromatin assembly factor 1 subunit A-domain-containing protein n=1 Tax=Cokeromyces recurvatus TaxID=90255 RepID=UPI00221F8D33|nr:chromatin assembly factor 1 subunit A-domain-containing protein [Cokeromyces recurvatus]KAI7898159.1 chromatin assembly factor 1 subunit A-domain-containing protein [Cokeromyces recurvatus]
MNNTSFNDFVANSNNQNLIKGYTFIKSGHVVFSEERLRIENHLLISNAIINFREWRENFELIRTDIHPSDIPKEFTDLIAMLSHESDESLNDLAHRLNDLLSPFEKNKEASIPFYNAIKQVIKVTAYQERYGLADVVLLLTGTPPLVPERLCFFRWQAYDTTIFPADIIKAAQKRRERRKLFSSIFTNAFQSLTAAQRIELLFNESGNFFIESTKKDLKENNFNGYYATTLNQNTKVNETTQAQLFAPFKPGECVTVAPPAKTPRKRICSSFDTLFYIGLNDSFDLRQRFLNELSPEAKRKRGIKNYRSLKGMIDLKRIWLESITTSVNRHHCRDNSYNSRTNSNKQLRLLKMKLLQFHEDVRPAYYGTWTKAINHYENSIVTGRRPFAKDKSLLNYDYDSEAEWDIDIDPSDDIYILSPDEDNTVKFSDSTDEDDENVNTEDKGKDKNVDIVNEDEEETNQWLVPEGYLSEDEGIYVRKRRARPCRPIESRPAKWPMSRNKHFPMKPFILGPSFELPGEPENHPLSDFKLHILVNNDSIGYAPFGTFSDKDIIDQTDGAEKEILNSTSLAICFEPSDKVKPPLYQREVDKIMNSDKKELIDVIMENKTKTMMGLVGILKSREKFSEYTTAQLQAMIHDLATQEIRGTNKEYNWYLRATS